MNPVYKVLSKNDLMISDESCEIYWDKMIIVNDYEISKRSIYEIKFMKNYYLAGRIAKKSAQCLRDLIESADLITSVPMHWKKRMLEGENHARIIAQYFSRLLKVKYIDLLYIDKKPNMEQKKMDRIRRFIYKIGRYKILGDKVNNKSVVIVDDVVTTGATVNECARIIKKNGAKKVTVLALSGIV